MFYIHPTVATLEAKAELAALQQEQKAAATSEVAGTASLEQP